MTDPVFNVLFLCTGNDAAGETCPAWPGQPMTAHWGIEDPAAVEGIDIEKERAFAQAFRYLKNRINTLHRSADPKSRLALTS